MGKIKYWNGYKVEELGWYGGCLTLIRYSPNGLIYINTWVKTEEIT